MELVIPGRETSLGVDVPVRLWYPPGTTPEQPMSLLVVNDSEDYEQYAGLTEWLGQQIAARNISPFRAALLMRDVGLRHELYSASPAYSQAVEHLIQNIIPRYAEVKRPIVGMGASLGAHAMLAMGIHCPGNFDGLSLQSPTLRNDVHTNPLTELSPEQRKRIAEVTNAVGQEFQLWPKMRISLSSSTAEGNFAYSHALAAALRSRGHAVELTEVHGDGHNYQSWREISQVSLPGLLNSEILDYTPEPAAV